MDQLQKGIAYGVGLSATFAMAVGAYVGFHTDVPLSIVAPLAIGGGFGGVLTAGSLSHELSKTQENSENQDPNIEKNAAKPTSEM